MVKKSKKRGKAKKNSVSKDKYLKLHSVNLGIAGGIVSGICVFLTTLTAIFGWIPDYTDWATSVLEAVYGFAGYGVNFQGLVLGTIYVFVDVFILMLIFGFIYNKLTKRIK